MARISRLFFCFFLSFCIPFLHAQDDPLYIPSDQVTLEYLASSPWTNHVIFFEKIFKKFVLPYCWNLDWVILPNIS